MSRRDNQLGRPEKSGIDQMAENMQKKQEPYRTLPWGYCECGCKGYALAIGSQFFWVEWDLKKRYDLYRGHGRGQRLGTFPSWEAADREARQIARPQFMKEFARMQELARELGIPMVVT